MLTHQNFLRKREKPHNFLILNQIFCKLRSFYNSEPVQLLSKYCCKTPSVALVRMVFLFHQQIEKTKKFSPSKFNDLYKYRRQLSFPCFFSELLQFRHRCCSGIIFNLCEELFSKIFF